LSPVKIGRAVHVGQRVASLQTGTPHELRVLRILKGDRESEMHARFADDRIRGEWFRWSRAIEAFVEEPWKECSPVWHMVNMYCTNEQRRQFNEWHLRMYSAADAVRDWVHVVSLQDDRTIPKEIEEMMDQICDVPVLD
jgi:hypothetical protein